MPSKHSKNAGDLAHFTYNEKKKAGHGSVSQRLGTDSQLPFGYCSLSLQPITDGVVTPSGHMYEREVILEYLLTKTRELKQLTKQYEEEQERLKQEQEEEMRKKVESELNKFAENVDGVGGILKRKIDDTITVVNQNQERRLKLIDDTAREDKIADLRRVSPWIPQFTPETTKNQMKAPPKRPSSPMSGRPLRVADLIPVDLIRESQEDNLNVKYICSVSRNTITNQKVIVLKNTHQMMIEDFAKKLAYPTMTCPVTGKKFKEEDVVELARSASAYAASGSVEAKVYKPFMT